ncbi:hypothetical protein Ancab_020505 [Ancistrocladus abbreviatus]
MFHPNGGKSNLFYSFEFGRNGCGGNCHTPDPSPPMHRGSFTRYAPPQRTRKSCPPKASYLKNEKNPSKATISTKFYPLLEHCSPMLASNRALCTRANQMFPR